MGLKTLVKISSVNNLSDARYCAGMGVELMGFNLDEASPDYVDPQKFREITSWVAGVEFVGEADEILIPSISKLIGQYQLNYLQIARIDDLKELISFNIPIILKVNFSDFESAEDLEKMLNECKEYVSYFLLESDKNENSSTINSNKVTDLYEKYPIILGEGIQPDNVLQIVNTLKIRGISLKGGNEIKPGYKDFDELADILELLED